MNHVGKPAIPEVRALPPAREEFAGLYHQQFGYLWHTLRHLGVPEFDGDRRIKRILEKPEDPPSHYGVTGIYFYPADVFDVIGKLKPSGRGELEITDVNNWFIAQGTMEYDVLTGFWGDAGESIDAYYAVNDFVRQHGANKPATVTRG